MSISSQFILFSYAYYLPFVVLSICNSISENSFLELLETVDKVLFGVNVSYAIIHVNTRSDKKTNLHDLS